MSSSSELTSRSGGNTACIEVTCGDHTLIIDAGSGLRLLGDHFMKGGPERLHLFFTHCHYDHISGLPFFAPFFSPKTKIDIWSGHMIGDDKTRRMIADYMRPPFFPVGPEIFSADISYRDFEPTDRLEPEAGIVMDTMALRESSVPSSMRSNESRSIFLSSASVCWETSVKVSSSDSSTARSSRIRVSSRSFQIALKRSIRLEIKVRSFKMG